MTLGVRNCIQAPTLKADSLSGRRSQLRATAHLVQQRSASNSKLHSAEPDQESSLRLEVQRAHELQPSTAPAPQQLAEDQPSRNTSRRDLVRGASLGAAVAFLRRPQPVLAEDSSLTPMEALKGKDYGKPRLRYKDYVMTGSGLQYTDLVQGTGEMPKPGDTVVIDWDGYTIGYYGRPFEARNKPKGSSFTGEDKDFFKFRVGAKTVIPAFEEAIADMRVGGIRRIIVPEELGYPDNDFSKGIGPAPLTFAGRRTLDFVLKNRGMIDKTLLFDIELIKILS